MPDIGVEHHASSPKQQPSVVGASKDNRIFAKRTTDLALISSDGVAFRVHRIILSEASTFFETMFSLPQPVPSRDCNAFQEEHDGLCAIHMTEPEDVIESLLRLCYPIDDPVLTDPGHVGMVLAAAMKYEMDEATKIAKERLLSFVEATPVRVYAIACFHRFESVASVAAHTVLSNGFSSLSLPPTVYVSGMEDIPAGSYHRLCTYCRCGGNVSPGFRFCDTGYNESYEALPLPSSPCNPRDPFDIRTMPDPDVILRSSDQLEFQVQRSILCLASPILRTKIDVAMTSPTPRALEETSSSPTLPKLPVVELPEINGQSLAHLLQVLYPVFPPAALFFPDIAALLEAAKTYGIDRLFVFAMAELEARLETQPLRVYLIASKFADSDTRFSPLVDRAARYTLGEDVLNRYHPEMENVSCYHFYRLLGYHRDCHDAASWSIERGRVGPGFKEGHGLLCWYTTVAQEMRVIIKRKPAGSAILAPDALRGLVAKVESNRSALCAECVAAPTMTAVLQACETLAQWVDDAIAKVSLKSYKAVDEGANRAMMSKKGKKGKK